MNLSKQLQVVDNGITKVTEEFKIAAGESCSDSERYLF